MRSCGWGMEQKKNEIRAKYNIFIIEFEFKKLYRLFYRRRNSKIRKANLREEKSYFGTVFGTFFVLFRLKKSMFFGDFYSFTNDSVLPNSLEKF